MIVEIDIQPRITAVSLNESKLAVQLTNDRTVTAPLSWYPRLQHAIETERNGWRVFEDSEGRDIIFGEQIDEFIPVIALLVGVASRESQRSVERWLEKRYAAATSAVT